MRKIIFILTTVLLLFGCRKNSLKYDAVGVFEAKDLLVSTEVQGVVKALNVEEGELLSAGQEVGYIDTTQLYLQKRQLFASKKVLQASKPDTEKQMQALHVEIAHLRSEKNRIVNLRKGDAATEQQLDDIIAKIKIAESRLSARQNTLYTSVESLNEQISAVEIQIIQIDEKIRKSRIVNPMTGVVLRKYTNAGEVALPARPLYRIADMNTIFLRTYVGSSQLSKLKLGQTVNVYSDYDKNETQKYSGKITWISEKAEFTPKTIQTKNERENLVYAVKIAVKNDGMLKIGMYGEAEFVPQTAKK